MAQVSYGTITITDTNDIERIYIEYCRSASNQLSDNVVPNITVNWGESTPAWINGEYIWQRSVIKKSGIDNLIYGTPVCLTGAQGQTGGTGRSLTGTETKYTNVASNTTKSQVEELAENNWVSNVPSYNSSKPDYWVRIKNTYDGAPLTEYIYYKDNGITESIAKANEAWNKADQAQSDASDALEQATAANEATALLGGHFIYNSEWQTNNTPHSANIVQTILKNEIDVTTDPSQWDYNVHIGANGIRLRNNESVLSEWTSTALRFNNPSNGNAQLIIGANGTLQSGNYIAPTITENDNEGTSPYSVAGSKFDLTYGNIITPNFVLDNDEGNAYLKGTIITEDGLIGGFVITENAIYHNKRDITSVDLSDDIYIINNDPYVLDEEDYLYGGYASLYEVYMGIDGISCGFGKFAVDSTGELFASNATIKGNITATSGSFGTDNGYYEISDDGLIGYKIETSYYFKMIEIIINGEYDEGTIEFTSLSVETSSQTYSYSDILAMSVVTGVDLKYEDDKIYAIIKTSSSISISEIFDGTITTISCFYTYKQSGEEISGFNETYDYSGITAAITENNDYITGTEVGYDYIKTNNIIANGGTISGWKINGSLLYSYTDKNGQSATSTNAKYYVYINGDGGANGGNYAFGVRQRTDEEVDANSPSIGTSTVQFGVSHSGSLYAIKGKIGGFTLGSTSLNAYGTGSGAGTSDTGISRLLIQSAPGTGTNVAFGVANRESTSDSWSWTSYIRHNGSFVSNNADIKGKITATSGKIGNWNISNGVLTASGTWEDYQDWDWSYTMNIQPGSFDMSYYVLRDEEGNSVPRNYYAGHTSIENDYISLFSQSSGSPSDETILRPGDISTTYITTYQISSSLSSDLIISSNDSTWSCRLTQYGNFRPGGIDSAEDSHATGQQLLGTKDNRWKQVYVTTAEDVNSDIKTKDNIEEIDFSETLIRNLKPVSFMLKNSNHRRKHMGFIAQDVSQLCKDIGENLSVVSASYKYEPEGGKEYFGEDVDDNLLSWGITYDELIAPMVLEIQRLMDRVDKLECELNELKGVNR